MNLNQAIAKLFESLTSVKFFLICLSTWLFYIDKLSESGWLMLILSVTGMRVANELSAVYKDVRIAQIEKAKK